MAKTRDTERLAYIQRLCLSGDTLHIEIAQLIASLSTETRYSRSTESLRPSSEDRTKARASGRRRKR